VAYDIFFRADVASLVVGIEAPLLETAQSKQFMKGVHAMAIGMALAIGVPRGVFEKKVKDSLPSNVAVDLFGD